MLRTALSLLFLLPLAACIGATKVKVWTVPETIERRYASVLDDGRLSPVSAQVVAEHGFDETVTLAGLDSARERWHGEPWAFELARAELAALEALDGSLTERALVLDADHRALLLDAVLSAWRARELLGESNVFDPRHRHAVDLYNAALDLLVRESLAAYGSPDNWKRLPSVNGPIEVELAITEDYWLAPARSWDPAFFDKFLVADTVQWEGLRERHRDYGVGTPLVAIRDNDGSRPEDRFYPPEGIVRAVTAVLRPADDGERVRLSLCDPIWLTPEAGYSVPLAADYSAPFAYLIAKSKLQALGTAGFFDANRAAWHQGLFLLQPYDPTKIPVVMVHGLMSNPLTWRDSTVALWGDPELRRRYQVWHFMYPTANPVLISARDLRQALLDVRETFDPEGDDPAMQSMVVVAHSMGGLLSKALVQDPGDRYWDLRFTRPIDELDLTPEDRQALEEIFYFEPLPFVDRIVFNATPHRGSEFAYNAVSALGDNLLVIDSQTTAVRRRVEERNPGSINAAAGQSIPTSIDVLKPTNPFLLISAELPLDPSVPYHVVIGDSDDIVPYESSSLPGAASEVILPGEHDIHTTPAAIAELQRILREHRRPV
ncbi:MAG: alpha/beta hydrolase, partial [Planctomycetota bacterium]